MNYESRQHYKVLGRCQPKDVLPYISPEAPNKIFFNHSVKMTSLRYQTFSKSTECVCCGIKGTVMLLELPHNKNVSHFNLYAEREGRLIQMTKDHIQPKSKGGKDFIGNMQTMCCHCNELKGDHHLKGGNTKVLQKLRKIKDGTQTIYRVSTLSPSYERLEGFATTPRGIIRLIERYLEFLYPNGVEYEITVDMSAMRVILIQERVKEYVYNIHKIERV